MPPVSPMQCLSYNVSPNLYELYAMPMGPNIIYTQPTPVSQGNCVLESPYMPVVFAPSPNIGSDSSQNTHNSSQNSIQVFNFGDVGSNSSVGSTHSANSSAKDSEQICRDRGARNAGSWRANSEVPDRKRGRPGSRNNLSNVTTRNERLKLLKRIVKDEVGCGSVCWHWTRRGYCNYGDACQFRHPTQQQDEPVKRQRNIRYRR